MLDNAKTYSTNDPDDIAYGIDHLAEQVRVAWREARLVRFPAAYKGCREIVIVGMGGSALGPDMVVHAFGKSLTVPVSIVQGYSLPAHVGSRTLVVLSSLVSVSMTTLTLSWPAKISPRGTHD